LVTNKKNIIIVVIISVVVTVNLFTILSQEKTNKNTCVNSGCHNYVMRGWFKHPPAREDCTNCHNYVKGNHPDDNGKEFELNAKVPDLCTNCHDINKGEKSKHAPVAQGNCLTCHDPHSSDVKELVKTEKGKSICLKCHDVSGKNMASVHGPVLKNECNKCHEPHNSKYPKLLIDEETKLCLTCHNKTITGKVSTIPNIKLKISSKNVHDPVAGGCSNCHTPHASKNNALLTTEFNRDTYIYEKDKTGVLCFTCHSDDILLKDKPESTGFRDGKNNLHFLHVNREKSRNCTVCHDVHGSDLPHLINKTVLFGKWEFPLKYSQRDDGGLCAPACHNLFAYVNKDKQKNKTTGAIPGIPTQYNGGQLNCEIETNKGFGQNNIKNLKFHIINDDNSFIKDLELNDSLVLL